MPVLKPEGQGLSKFCITVQCHLSSVFFFYLKPLYFGQKEPIKVKFSEF